MHKAFVDSIKFCLKSARDLDVLIILLARQASQLLPKASKL